MFVAILPFNPSTVRLEQDLSADDALSLALEKLLLDSLTIKDKPHNNGNRSQPINNAPTITVNNRPKQTNKVGTALAAAEEATSYTSDTLDPLSILLRDQAYNPLRSDNMLIQGNTGSSPVFHKATWSDSSSCLKQRLNWHLQQCISDLLAADSEDVRELKGELLISAEATNWAIKLSSSSEIQLQQLRQRLLCTLLQQNRSRPSDSDEIRMEREKRDDEEFAAICSPFMEAADLAIQPNSSKQQHEPSIQWGLDVYAYEVGPLLGRKELVKKVALLNGCTLDACCNDAACTLFPQQESSVSIKVRGPSERAINSTREMLLNRCHEIRTTSQFMHSARIYITDGQKDWLKTGAALTQLNDIKWEYGLSVVAVPEDANYLAVFASSPALLSGGLKSLQQDLLSQHQTVNLTLSNVADLRDMQPSQEALELMALSTGCSISLAFRDSTSSVALQLGGEVSALVRCLLRLAHEQQQPMTALSLQMTVPADIRDFLCGKKDGKLLRIVRETGVHVELVEPEHPCQTLIVLLRCDCSSTESSLSCGLGPSTCLPKSQAPGAVYQPPHQRNFARSTATGPLLANLLQARKLVDGELPAELQFHVPETHHKRMIGHGGKTIQRIMKKYGVYVKFMGVLEAFALNHQDDPFPAAQARGAAQPIVPNVVVRTPAKNQAALHGIRDEILTECCAAAAADEDGSQRGCPVVDHVALRALHQLQDTCRQVVALPYSLALLRATEGAVEGLEVSVKEHAGQIACEGNAPALQELKTRLTAFSPEDARGSPTGCPQPSASPSAFKHFPSALFVDSGCCSSASPRLSPSWSQLLLELDSRNQSAAASSLTPPGLAGVFLSPSPSLSMASSVSMSSVADCNQNFSPNMIVGGSKAAPCPSMIASSSSTTNRALAETRRRSAALFQ